MSKRELPAAPVGRPIGGIQTQVLPRAFDRWNPSIRAAESDQERSISIYDVIGYDFWSGDGVTAKRIAGALRGMGPGPVTVNINSPGGDLFEGLAIYNLLREHDGEVNVKVLGLAASAASIIGMSGDNVQIARAGFFMIHDTWMVAVGNRLDFAEFAEWLEPFDSAMADVYAVHTGMEHDAIMSMMDAETWIGGTAAVEQGFADELLPSDQVDKKGENARAAAAGIMRRIEAALRQSGLPKSEAMRLISEFKSAAGDPGGSGEGDPAGQHRADPELVRQTVDKAESLLSNFQGIT